jgi:acetyl esterase
MPLDPKAKALLDQLSLAPLPPFATLDAATFRAIMDTGFLPSPPVPLAEIEERDLPGAAGTLKARLYRAIPGDAQPALVFFHGGGFVIGTLDTHDTLCRLLANEAGCTVISIAYRLAPEHKFPAGVEDAETVTEWIAEHGRTLGIDPARLAVGGDSAGGNIAAVTALRLRERGSVRLCHQLLIYPVTDLSGETLSHKTNGEGYFLTSEMMGWFAAQYLPSPDALTDPRVSPLLAADLGNLPPASVITAEYDPLRDEGEAYAQRLAAAGVPTRLKRYDGMPHGFVSMVDLLDQADTGIAWAAEGLREGFGTAR